MSYFISFRYDKGKADGFGRVILDNCTDPNENTSKFLGEAERYIEDTGGYTNVIIINYKRAY
jgi:hypothetical protein